MSLRLLSSLDRLHRRPRGHAPRCTCDKCWQAASALYNERYAPKDASGRTRRTRRPIPILLQLPVHLRRLDRYGRRPEGHPVFCTCDHCWAAADALFVELEDLYREAQRQNRIRNRARAAVRGKIDPHPDYRKLYK